MQLSKLQHFKLKHSEKKNSEIQFIGFARRVNDGEVLISFLKELAANGRVSQIDKTFRSGDDTYPLVNKISCEYKDKFNELFSKLPEEYQNKLLGETISYEEGDKTYTCSLIGGTALMGFQLGHKFYTIVYPKNYSKK